jgi:RNA polymerase sigma-70 factor (ECF subfamily)
MDPSVSGFRAGAAQDPGAPAQARRRRGPSTPSDHADAGDAAAELDDEERSEEDGPDSDPAQLPRGACVESLDNAALARLIGRVMRQDEAALADLYEQLSGRVYAVALRITRQVACAEEVLQDTFWQVWRQAPRFDPQRGSALAWVLMMARSRALDALRAKARDPVQTHPQPVDDEHLFSDDAADDPLDLLQAVRRDSALHAQLARLDPLRRQLIALAFFRGMTHDEIADHTGLPLGTVKSHFRRTLAALQDALGPDFLPSPAGSPR